MLDHDPHLSDEQLIMAADGELPVKQGSAAQAHLAACWTCRVRMQEIQQTISEVVRVYRDELESEIPPSVGLRVELKRRLRQLATEPAPRTPWLQQWLVSGWHQASMAAGLCLLFTAAVVVQWHQRHVHSSSAADRLAAHSLPNPQLTPGVTRAVTIGEICSLPHEEVIREVPSDLQRKVFREYGLQSYRRQDYEVDYLITPGLGGADQLGNLWPEPYSGNWNARRKDELEQRLHEMVCENEIDLSTAQHDIATDWIAAYKKYVHTGGPIRSSSILNWPPTVVRSLASVSR